MSHLRTSDAAAAASLVRKRLGKGRHPLALFYRLDAAR